MLDHNKMVEALPAYDVGGEIGRGAWGIVYSARHRRLNREVAIKQLPRAFGNDPAVRERFANEARILATFGHPHIVEIYDYVEHEGLCLLVMELLPGGSLADRHRAQPLDPKQACAVALAASTALHCAHAQGVLHRDVKPENIMFSRRGVVKVTDFGIAKVLIGTGRQFTEPGVVLGTPAFMAPEQAQGVELTPATDVYSLAMVLYELLAGELPFPDDSDPIASLYQRVHESPKPLAAASPETPESVTEVVDHALRRDPAERFATAEDFGLVVAAGARQAWGPGWLEESGVELHGSGRIVAVATSNGHGSGDKQPARATVASTPSRETVASAPQPVAGAVKAPRISTEVRTRRTPWALGFAALLVAVAVAAFLLTRSGADDPGTTTSADRPAPTVTTTTPRPPADLPASGVVPPGSYLITTFQPPVLVTFGVEWEVRQLTAGTATMRRPGAEQFLELNWADQVVDAQRKLGSLADIGPATTAAPPASQMVSWFAGHPRLRVTPPRALPGPAKGVGTEVTVVEGYPFRECERPCVPLFSPAGEESVVVAYEGVVHRLVTFVVGERALVALSSGGPTSDPAFAAEVEGVLSSLTVAQPA